MTHITALLVSGPLCFALLLQAAGARQEPRRAEPLEPVAALVTAFQTHDIVTLTDPHGNVQVQAFLLALVRDPRLVGVVQDIVIETASARYQDVIDRFTRGENVAPRALRQAWEEHTVPNSLGVQAEELLRAVRLVNASLAEVQRFRVLAGDPPIDWEQVSSPGEHAKWIELRDSYPADLIRRQVLDRGRRALVVYGQGHLARRQLATNYDMSAWQAQTVVSLLERDHRARVFNTWTLNRAVDLPQAMGTWRVPSLALLAGTRLGAVDVAMFERRDGPRVILKAGQLVSVRRDAWITMRMDEQFDALLYLGPPESMTIAPVPASLCADTPFVNRRIARLARIGPSAELQGFKQACGL